MRLWHLTRHDVYGTPGYDPTLPRLSSYDESHSFVVRASSEVDARALAQDTGGDEVRRGPFWTDPSKTRCDLLMADGEAGIVCQDFNAG